MANLDKKPQFSGHNTIEEREASPNFISTKAKGAESKVKQQRPGVKGPERPEVSPKVPSSSLPGWVSRNKSHFEPTEGRF